MTELLQIENKLSEILDELKKMNERFKYSSDPDTKQILKELKEMNARAREEEYKKTHPSDSNREDHETWTIVKIIMMFTEIISEIKKIDLQKKIESLEDKVSLNLDEKLYSELLSLRNQIKGG